MGLFNRTTITLTAIILLLNPETSDALSKDKIIKKACELAAKNRKKLKGRAKAAFIKTCIQKKKRQQGLKPTREEGREDGQGDTKKERKSKKETRCEREANKRKLKGKARKKFIRECLYAKRPPRKKRVRRIYHGWGHIGYRFGNTCPEKNPRDAGRQKIVCDAVAGGSDLFINSIAMIDSFAIGIDIFGNLRHTKIRAEDEDGNIRTYKAVTGNEGMLKLGKVYNVNRVGYEYFFIYTGLGIRKYGYSSQSYLNANLKPKEYSEFIVHMGLEDVTSFNLYRRQLFVSIVSGLFINTATLYDPTRKDRRIPESGLDRRRFSITGKLGFQFLYKSFVVRYTFNLTTYRLIARDQQGLGWNPNELLGNHSISIALYGNFGYKNKNRGKKRK